MKLFTHARIFTMDQKSTLYEDGYLMTDGEHILKVGNCPDLKKKEVDQCQVIDLGGRVVIPGMITTHAHFYGCFSRGMSLSQPVCNWQQMLTRMWWKFDKKLTPDMNYYSALMGLIEGLKSGTTMYFDHQASAYSTDGVLDLLESAVRKAGARACLSYEVSDRDGLDHRDSGIRENVRFIKKTSRSHDHRVGAMFGLHAGYSCGRETLEEAAQYGRELGCGFHIHVAESQADVSESYRLYDCHVAERLYREGILGNKTIAAHSVHVGPEEWGLYRQTDTTAVNNAQSNAGNAVGISPVVQMMNDKVTCALGGDGCTYDMFRELNIAVLMQKIREHDPRVFTSEQMRRFAFENPGSLTERAMGIRTGVLAAGAAADFSVVDFPGMTPLTQGNIFANMTTAFTGHVKDVYVSGEEVVHDGKLVNIDEEEAAAKCREQAQLLWDSLD